MDLGSVLRQAREQAGLTQGAIAQQVGVSRFAISRWESGARPVASDDADRVLAACGRDVRFQLVTRHADVDETLARLASLSFRDRIGGLRVLSPDILHELQGTDGVLFTGAWAAAALGLQALHDVGGLLVGADPVAQGRVAAVLRPWSPLSLAPGGPWSIIWNDDVFARNPSLRLHTTLLGEFSAEVAPVFPLELRVSTDQVPWRLVDPSLLVPEHVDANVLDRWRQLRAT
ncbi:MAG: HTH-type transcriptional regulator / antitoxin HipB [Actinomycetota bacterium]|jgi:transcriptional regulator with XRE-family HTH domain|nr:HTH-type transcriptional regulator / antitoxin HipB [Actinomycetota bacterium]